MSTSTEIICITAVNSGINVPKYLAKKKVRKKKPFLRYILKTKPSQGQQFADNYGRHFLNEKPVRLLRFPQRLLSAGIPTQQIVQNKTLHLSCKPLNSTSTLESHQHGRHTISSEPSLTVMQVTDILPCQSEEVNVFLVNQLSLWVDVLCPMFYKSYCLHVLMCGLFFICT